MESQFPLSLNSIQMHTALLWSLRPHPLAQRQCKIADELAALTLDGIQPDQWAAYKCAWVSCPATDCSLSFGDKPVTTLSQITFNSVPPNLLNQITHVLKEPQSSNRSRNPRGAILASTGTRPDLPPAGSSSSTDPWMKGRTHGGRLFTATSGPLIGSSRFQY